MAGAIVIIIVLVVLLPVAVLISGAVGAAVFGALLERDRDRDNRDADGAPNEYLTLSEANPYRA